eukprot:gene3763-4285_t
MDDICLEKVVSSDESIFSGVLDSASPLSSAGEDFEEQLLFSEEIQDLILSDGSMNCSKESSDAENEMVQKSSGTKQIGEVETINMKNVMSFQSQRRWCNISVEDKVSFGESVPVQCSITQNTGKKRGRKKVYKTCATVEEELKMKRERNNTACKKFREIKKSKENCILEEERKLLNANRKLKTECQKLENEKKLLMTLLPLVFQKFQNQN